MQLYQYPDKNVGDTLSKPILEYFLNTNVELVHQDCCGKFVGVGSIIWAVRPGDTVWGTGLITDTIPTLPTCKVLALRGKLTAKNLKCDCKVFGDPGLLLPLMYDPYIEKKHKIGIVEHYVDKGLYKHEGHRIDVTQPWKTFVDEINSCERIISSSLHGLVISEAYGIPVEWVVLSNRVVGGGFKFRDYLTGTNRTDFSQPFDLTQIQIDLLTVLKTLGALTQS